jgi:predicted nucleic acid-binding protein
MAKYIIDTNIFIASIWNKKAELAIKKANKKNNTIIICSEILKEYKLIIQRMVDKNIITDFQKKKNSKSI